MDWVLKNFVLKKNLFYFSKKKSFYFGRPKSAQFELISVALLMLSLSTKYRSKRISKRYYIHKIAIGSYEGIPLR